MTPSFLLVTQNKNLDQRMITFPFSFTLTILFMCFQELTCNKLNLALNQTSDKIS